jgi:hypothetical protein
MMIGVELSTHKHSKLRVNNYICKALQDDTFCEIGSMIVASSLPLVTEYFFHVTDLRSSPKTKTTFPQWFQSQVLGFVKMDKVELRQ